VGGGGFCDCMCTTEVKLQGARGDSAVMCCPGWRCGGGGAVTLPHTVHTVYAYQRAVRAPLSQPVYSDLFWENSTSLLGRGHKSLILQLQGMIASVSHSHTHTCTHTFRLFLMCLTTATPCDNDMGMIYIMFTLCCNKLN